MKTGYLCIHILQTVPASCINRDDTGTPKSCIYGGAQRMRVSSQCWKKAIRKYMKDKYGDTGIRTKLITRILSDKLAESTGCSKQEAEDFVKEWIDRARIAAKDKKDTSAFFSEEQINAVAKLLSERFSEEKAGEEHKEKEAKFVANIKDAVMMNPSVSELLFGRMFAKDPQLNYDAACQVAHAFSVEEVFEEPDYFTAVGDIKIEEMLAGSDHINTKLFTSGTMYRFADLNLSDGSDLRSQAYNVNVAETAGRFLEAFALSMPTGSANSYANMTLPTTIIVELRDDIPVSFAPAFTDPIKGKDIPKTAAAKMIEYENWVTDNYGGPVKRWVLGETPLKEICKDVEVVINRRL